jgi:hypothetical protein
MTGQEKGDLLIQVTAGFKSVNGITTAFDNWISNNNTDINK